MHARAWLGCSLPLLALLAACGGNGSGDPNELPGQQIGVTLGGGGSSSSSASTSASVAASSSTSSGATTVAASSSSTGPAPMWSASADATTLSADLYAQTTLHVTIEPMGYKGDVSLGLSGLPGDVDASFDTPNATLDGASELVATLTITTHTDTVTGAYPFSISVQSTGEATSLDAALTVNPSLTIHIPQGIDGMMGGNSYGPDPFVISAQGVDADHPVSVYFMNDDDKSHFVHAESPEFPHDPNAFPAHSMDPFVRTPHDPGTYQFYLHDEGGPQNVGAVQIK